MTFFTKENLKIIVNILKDYMLEKYELSFNQDEDNSLRKIIYDIMTKVNNDCVDKNIPIQTMNMNVLTIAQNFLIKKYKLQNDTRKPNISNLSRDKSVFGDRQVNSGVMIPDVDPYLRKQSQVNEIKETMIDRMVVERDRDLGIERRNPNDVSHIIVPTIDKADDPDDFVKRLKQFENQRNVILDDLEAKRPKNKDEENYIKESLMMNRMQVSKEIQDSQNYDPKLLMTTINNHQKITPMQDVYSKFSEGKEQVVIPKNIQSCILEKYLSINSFDRDWTINPLRYSYPINFLTNNNSIQNRYRNINSMSVTRVVIPEEIVQSSPIQTSFTYDFTFSFPYLLLTIDEFNDVYDGTNDHVRKTFCKLIYDKNYKGQNGRGYLVLKPMQKEKKIFYPAPLSTLNKLTFSLLKPNGSLFNNSLDNYNALAIEYDNTKPNYIKITFDSYYDKNEFYIGDYILIKNYLMTKLSPIQKDADIQGFNDYINRSQGFEILEIGTANSNGFYNVLYIQAPGNFDKTIGQYQLNMNLINCLNTYNANIVTPTNNGIIMNFSLQNSISIKLDVIVDDAKILDAQKNFNL